MILSSYLSSISRNSSGRLGVLWVYLSDIIELDGDLLHLHVGLQKLRKGLRGWGPVEGVSHGPSVGVQLVLDATEAGRIGAGLVINALIHLEMK